MSLSTKSTLTLTVPKKGAAITAKENDNLSPRRISIGLDLGAGNVRFATASEGSDGRVVVKLLNGGKPIPSAFSVIDEKRGFGKWAQLNTPQPDNLIIDGLSVLSHPYSASVKNEGVGEIPHRGQLWAAQKDADGQYHVPGGVRSVDGEHFSQPEVIAAFIGHVRDCVLTADEQKQRDGHPLEIASLAVVVPSFCGQNHRRMILQAVKIAGFSEETTTSVHLMNQSTAIATALLCYQNVQRIPYENVLILSMGAESIECSVFAFEGDHSPRLLVTRGQVGFGGNSFTAAIVNALVGRLRREHKEPFEITAKHLKTIWFACETAKKELSECFETDIQLVLDDSGEEIEYRFNVNHLKKCAHELIAQLEAIIREVVQHPEVDQIDRVLLAGGSTLPFCYGYSSTEFFKIKIIVDPGKIIDQCAIVPEHAAVRGAALRAAHLLYRPRDMPACFRQFSIPEYVYAALKIDIVGIEANLAPSGTPLPFTREVIVTPNALITFKEGDEDILMVRETSQGKRVHVSVSEKDGVLVPITITDASSLFVFGWGLLSGVAEANAIGRERAYQRREASRKDDEKEAKRREQAAAEAIRRQKAQKEAEARQQHQPTAAKMGQETIKNKNDNKKQRNEQEESEEEEEQEKTNRCGSAANKANNGSAKTTAEKSAQNKKPFNRNDLEQENVKQQQKEQQPKEEVKAISEYNFMEKAETEQHSKANNEKGAWTVLDNKMLSTSLGTANVKEENVKETNFVVASSLADGQQQQTEHPPRKMSAGECVKQFEIIIDNLDKRMQQFIINIQEKAQMNAQQCPLFRCYTKERDRLFAVSDAILLEATRVGASSNNHHQTLSSSHAAAAQLIDALEKGTGELVKLSETFACFTELLCAAMAIYNFVHARNPLLQQQSPPFNTRHQMVAHFIQFCECIHRDYIGRMKGGHQEDGKLRALLNECLSRIASTENR